MPGTLLAVLLCLLPGPARSQAGVPEGGTPDAADRPFAEKLGQQPRGSVVETSSQGVGGSPSSGQDLGRTIAGVVASGATDQGSFAPDFIFRGFPNGGVSLYDGLQYGFRSKTLDLVAIERTEFSKGAASYLFGPANEASGPAANYVTKGPDTAPGAKPFARASATAASFAFRRLEFDLGGPPGGPLAGNLATRLTGALQSQGSSVDFVNGRRAFVASSTTLTLDDGSTLNLAADLLRAGGVDNYGLPTSAPSTLFLALPRNVYAAIPSNEGLRREQEDVTLRYDRRLGGDWQLTAAADALRFAKGSGQYTDWRYDGARSIGFGGAERTALHSLSLDAQVNLRGHLDVLGTRHNLFFALDRWSFADRFTNRVAAAPLAPLDIFAPDYRRSIDYGNAFLGQGRNGSATTAVVAQDVIDLGLRWHLLLGARYDRLDGSESFADPSGDVTGSPVQFAGSGAVSNVSPRLGLLYRPQPSTSLFVAYGTTILPNTGVYLAGNRLPPEKDRQIEGGVRQALPGGRIRSEVALFDVTRDNVPANDFLNPTGFYSVVTDQQRSRGVEVSGEAKLTPALTAGFAGTFLRAVVARDGNVPSQAGSDLLGAPRYVVSASLSYGFATGALKGLDLGISLYATGRTQATLPNTPGFVLPAFRNLSASASYKVTEHVTASLRAGNLTDSANFTSDGVLQRGEPRTIGAMVAAR